MMIGIEGRLAFSCLQTSRPLMRGIITSSNTRSGLSAMPRCNPSTPSPALITSYPSYSKLSRRPATIAGSSSTIRMRVFLPAPTSALRRLPCARVSMSALLFMMFTSGCFISQLWRAGKWQRQGELASLSWRAFHLHVSSVCVCNVPDQCESQSAALCVVNQWVTGAIKLFEYLGLFATRDADAPIAHLEFQVLVLAIERHAQEFLVGRVLQSIVHEIHQ